MEPWTTTTAFVVTYVPTDDDSELHKPMAPNVLGP